MNAHESGKFRDATRLTEWTRWLLYSQIVISAVAVVSGGLEYQLLRDLSTGAFTSELPANVAASANDSRQAVVGMVQLVTTIVCGVLILRWIHRANFNARQLGASGMAFTPGWAIGWYFVPIATLWKPYQAMKEIWTASANPEDWKSEPPSPLLEREPVSPLLRWWWFFWLAASSLGNASLRSTLRADELDELIHANVITQISDLLTIPLCVLFLLIVGRIRDMQGLQLAKTQGAPAAIDHALGTPVAPNPVRRELWVTGVAIAVGCATLFLTAGERRAEASRVSGPLGSVTNPVRTKAPEGEWEYLGRLRCRSGEAPAFERLGSLADGVYGNHIDEYQVSCADKTVNVYMDMYHELNADTEPVPGFTFAVDHIRARNEL